MYHHAECPEFIQATLAERDRAIAAHYAQHEAERLLTEIADHPAPHPMRLLIGRLKHAFRPATRWHDQTAN